MTDKDKWALNREIAEGLEPLPPPLPEDLEEQPFSPLRCWRWNDDPYGEPARWEPIDFVGDLNAAWQMGERLREMGLNFLWTEIITRHYESNPEQYINAPALIRAQAAAEVLRERGDSNV